MRPPASVLQASRKELRATEPQRRAELLGPGRGGDRSGAEVEAQAELRTLERGVDGATDAGEGDLEAGRRRLRERAAGTERAAAARESSGSWKCGCNSH